jgi:high-affinity iron transporter
MLPTFVIALREGVEASLIVGIVAAFLVKEGRRDALPKMWLGVGIAVAICVAVAIVLRVVGESLPQKQQEGLETVIGLIAVAAVTYMIVWMRRNARGLKGTLQKEAAGALASGSAVALVGMAFLAVLREGLETAVFLLAVFQDTPNPGSAGAGAVLGLLAAVAIGYALYKGGVRINLSKFFRVTGLVLVFVAAGLLATALHTAHEAGWINSFQDKAFDLQWLVQPGTVIGSLLTGMLGLQPHPTVGEVGVYLLFAVPMVLFVVWPDRWRRRRESTVRNVATASLLLVALLVLAGCGGDGGSGSASSGGKGDAKVVKVTLSDDGCTPADLELQAGPTTFEVTGGGSGKVSEFEVFEGTRILGEVENLTPGLKKSFSLTLKPGDFVLSCTGGSQEPTGELTVTGGATEAAAAHPDAGTAVAAYRKYLVEQAGELVVKTQAFAAAVKAGDVAKAKALYGPARVPYERIEPVAEAFGGLDPSIDARAGDVPKSKWTGFHPIEQALWVKGSTKGMASNADGLIRDTKKLQEVVKTVELEPAQIANGAVELLGEVSRSKVTGEEERYSHIDLVDFQANVEGAQAAFESVSPILKDKDDDLHGTVLRELTSVKTTLSDYRPNGTFVSYTDLERADTRRLSQAVDALAEPLSRVPAQIVS